MLQRLVRHRVAHVFPATVVAGMVCIAFAVQIALIVHTTSGHFTYTLDDPYIHLALAREIHAGHYGITVGEFSSPSSSVLWPFLLSLTADLPFQQWMPLAINLLATIGTAVVLVAVFARVTSQRLAQVAAAAVGVLGLNLVGVAFTGMEHSLQILLASLIGYGVAIAVHDERLPRWLPAVMVVAPLLRYENAAVSLGAAAVLFGIGHRRAATVATAGWALLLAAFSGFLLLLDLDPLPSSVLGKSAYGSAPFLDVLQAKVEYAFQQPSFAVGVLLLGVDAVLMRRWGALHWFVAIVLAAQGVGGDFISLDRYEIYALSAVAPVLVAFVSQWPGRLGGLGKGCAALCAAMAVVSLVPLAQTTFMTAAASADIEGQQAQTAEFVRAYWKQPIAVNDLGLVAYRGGQRVFDLGGLASQDVRHARDEHRPSWMAPMVAAADIKLAAIYTDWYSNELPASWILVGSLSIPERVSSWGPRVDFYAIDAAAATEACAALSKFASHTPSRTTVTVTC